MNKWLLPISFLLLSIGIMIGAVFVLRKDEFPDVNNKSDCEDPSKTKLPKSCQQDSNCCAIWQNGVCRKGKKSDNNTCESKGDPIPLLLIILSIALFITFIVYFFKAMKQK